MYRKNTREGASEKSHHSWPPRVLTRPRARARHPPASAGIAPAAPLAASLTSAAAAPRAHNSFRSPRRPASA